MSKTSSDRVEHFGKNIGQIIRSWRLENGMTQREAGALVGVSGQQFQKYETAYSRIELYKMFEICRIFDKSPSEIFSASRALQNVIQDASSGETVGDRELEDQIDASYLVGQLISAFLSIRTKDDKELAIRIVSEIARKP